jgi:predicted transcriptional regulator
LHPESQGFAEQIFATSSQVLKFYSDKFCPYPFAQFSFITIKGMFARRAFSDAVGYEPKYLEKEFTTTGHDAHETSLLWWGYIIRGTGRGSSQWLEGFGDYAEVLYGEKYEKPLPKIFQFFKSKYLALPAEKDLLYTELRGNTDQAFVHGKYPWLMHLIRYVIGNKGFDRAMKLLFKKQKFHALTMAEFVATLEAGSGQSLQWFRDEWLNRRGVPTTSLKSEVQNVGGTYQIKCVLEQTGEIYHLPVEIGIQTEAGIKLEKVFMKEKQITARPTRVVDNPLPLSYLKRRSSYNSRTKKETMKANPKLGERELDILQALWKLGQGTVAEVHQELLNEGHEVAYTTVQTMLNRLEAKGRVARDASDRAHRYRPLFKEPAAVTAAIKLLAKRFFGGSVEELATHLVEKNLTPKQIERVRTMIDDHEKESQK